MLKKLVLALLMSLTFSGIANAQLACTPGYTAVAPDRASVATAVAAAPSGSVICLTAGSVTYTSGLDITSGATKVMHIQGAGSFVSPYGSAGQTIIYSNSSDYVLGGYDLAAGSSSISNIRFTYDASSSPITYGIILVSGNGASKQPFLIHHNDIFATGTCSEPKMIYIGSRGGVVYRNKLTADPSTCGYINTNVNGVKHSISDDGSWWNSASTFGSADTGGLSNLYVEANYFSGFNVAMDRHTSSRSVWRFNEMHSASIGDHGYDSSAHGERHHEVYNNTWYCDVAIDLSVWASARGGTGIYANNVFPAFNSSFCNFGGGVSAAPAISLSQFKAIQCEEISGWPGSYPGTYPISHQIGWGWINGSNQAVGASTAQNQPGGAGFQQALEPMYIANNTNSMASLLLRQEDYIGSCRGMAYSNSSKATGTTLTATAYVNDGQDAVVVFTDLVGGTAPTITDSIDGTAWTALTGGTNGSMRLSAWTKHIATTGAMTVTVTFDSSAAARAGTLVTMRGLSASPLDANPAVATDNTSPYTSPSSGTLAQANEIVLGYYALNGPTFLTGTDFLYWATTTSLSGGTGYTNGFVQGVATTGGTGTGFLVNTLASGGVISAISVASAGSGYTVGDTLTIATGGANATFVIASLSDALAITSPSTIAISQSSSVAAGLGIKGTSGGTTASNVTVGVSYRSVSATTAVAPAMTNATANRDGLAGTVSFKASGTTGINSVLDLQNTDFIAANREYYEQDAMFDGSSGTGSGARASRPMNCTAGVAYWSTDQGSWNTSGDGGQGVLDKCTATNTWTDAWYTPYPYPYPGTGPAGPTVGTSPVTSAVTSTSLTVTWGAATGTGTLTYYLGRSTSAIGSVSACLAATMLQDYTASFLTYDDTGLTPLTNYVYCVIAADDNGTSLYPTVSQTTTCGATKVVYTDQPASAALGNSLGTIIVQVQNASSTLCTDSSANVVLAKTSGATWNSLQSLTSLTKAATAGVATWTDVFVSPTIGAGTITASSSGLTDAVSSSVTISTPVASSQPLGKIRKSRRR